MYRINMLRNAIIASGHRRDVPREFDVIEYVETNGKQYVDLGFKVSPTQGKTKIVVTPSEIIGTIGLWGFTNISNTTYNISLGIMGTNWYNGLIDNTAMSAAEKDKQITLTIDRTNKVFTIDDLDQPYEFSGTISTAHTLNAFLFARNGGDATYGTNFSGKIYRYTEYDNNNKIIYDLVPANRKSSDEIGFYDVVNRTFLTNSGLGKFNEPPPISEEYIELEYLIFEGNQWLDTKLSNTGDYIFEGEFLSTDLRSTVAGDDGTWVIGGRVNPNYALGIFVGSGLGVVYGYGSTTRPISTPKLEENKWYYLYFDMNDLIVGTHTYNTINGTTVPLAYETNILLGKNQINWAGTGDDSRNFRGYMKPMTIRNRNTNAILRSFKPVRGSISGKVGMFDYQNNKFYDSTGPDEFIAGPDKV